jgi:hypothetical protein
MLCFAPDGNLVKSIIVTFQLAADSSVTKIRKTNVSTVYDKYTAVYDFRQESVHMENASLNVIHC